MAALLRLQVPIRENHRGVQGPSITDRQRGLR
jgi:hypothetical protein